MTRSEMMAGIKSKNTKPEILVRRAVHKSGLRFRLHSRHLPGKADLVLPRHKLVIFVHGCFWHQHPGCRLASTPKTRTDYWHPKLAANVGRDRSIQGKLREMGWRVEVIWECETRDNLQLGLRLEEIFGMSFNGILTA